MTTRCPKTLAEILSHAARPMTGAELKSFPVEGTATTGEFASGEEFIVVVGVANVVVHLFASNGETYDSWTWTLPVTAPVQIADGKPVEFV